MTVITVDLPREIGHGILLFTDSQGEERGAYLLQVLQARGISSEPFVFWKPQLKLLQN
jgi:hypothetical protein